MSDASSWPCWRSNGLLQTRDPSEASRPASDDTLISFWLQRRRRQSPSLSVSWLEGARDIERPQKMSSSSTDRRTRVIVLGRARALVPTVLLLTTFLLLHETMDRLEMTSLFKSSRWRFGRSRLEHTRNLLFFTWFRDIVFSRSSSDEETNREIIDRKRTVYWFLFVDGHLPLWVVTGQCDRSSSS